MAVSDLIQQARTRFGQSPSVLLRADEPTGEKPWEMLVTDEHTEHYLAIKTGGDSDRGMLTGALGVGGVTVLLMCSILILSGNRWHFDRSNLSSRSVRYSVPVGNPPSTPLADTLQPPHPRSLFRSQRQALP